MIISQIHYQSLRIVLENKAAAGSSSNGRYLGLSNAACSSIYHERITFCQFVPGWNKQGPWSLKLQGLCNSFSMLHKKRS
jgi:hypothetical protein